jgi:hypothetical protein
MMKSDVVVASGCGVSLMMRRLIVAFGSYFSREQ